MDLFDAIRDIRQQYPNLYEGEIRAAIDQEIESELARLKGSGTRGQYRAAIERAHARIINWLKTGKEFAVNPANLDDLCRFVSSHRQACVWAVLRSIQMDSTPFKCAGCGREEEVCSQEPCADVIADREK